MPQSGPLVELSRGCVPIRGATGMTYTPRQTDFRVPGAADIVHNLAFRETATSSSGLSSDSQQSGIVTVGTSSGPPPVFRPGFPGFSGGPPGGLLAFQIKAALSKLGPPAKNTTIRSLLKKGRATLTFVAPTPGKVAVAWYQVPAGAKVTAAAKKKKQPLLVATGTKTATKAGPVTVVVKLTKAGKKKLRATKRTLSLTSKASFTPTGAKATTRIARFKLKR